jgi:hypothetical protein
MMGSMTVYDQKWVHVMLEFNAISTRCMGARPGEGGRLIRHVTNRHREALMLNLAHVKFSRESNVVKGESRKLKQIVFGGSGYDGARVSSRGSRHVAFLVVRGCLFRPRGPSSRVPIRPCIVLRPFIPNGVRRCSSQDVDGHVVDQSCGRSCLPRRQAATKVRGANNGLSQFP